MSLFKKTSNADFHKEWSTESQNRMKWVGKILGGVSNIVESTKNAILNTFDNTKEAGKNIWWEMKRWFGLNPLKWWRSILNTWLIAGQLIFTKPTMAWMYAWVRAMWNGLWTTTQVALGNEYKNKLMIEWSEAKYWYFDGKWRWSDSFTSPVAETAASATEPAA